MIGDVTLIKNAAFSVGGHCLSVICSPREECKMNHFRKKVEKYVSALSVFIETHEMTGIPPNVPESIF